MLARDREDREPNSAPTSSVSRVASALFADRVVPRRETVRPLLRAFRPKLERQRKLAEALTIQDLRQIARRRVPRAVFDYTDGGANEEISLKRNRDAYSRVEFRPNYMRDVSGTHTVTTLLGEQSSFPLIFGPTGVTRLMHHEGEVAVARVADEVGIPYALSAAGTVSIEDLAQAFPEASKKRWFQLYALPDREECAALVRRARQMNYGALMVTVDCPVGGVRLRDLRHGTLIPPAPTYRTIFDGARRPAWSLNYLTRRPLRLETLESLHSASADARLPFLNPSLTLETLRWLRDAWDGKMIVKGVIGPEDASSAVEIGADAIVLSNHGGRQLDRVSVPLEQLPGVVKELGDRAEIYVDSGIMSGADVVAAVCMGAKAALVGRAFLYGLMAGGFAGVRRCAEIFAAEILQTMQLLGVTSVSELTSDHVRLRA